MDFNAREYIDNQNNNSLLFNLYHFPDDGHSLAVTTKISRSTLLYVAGHLSIIENLLLIRITQVNFIESAHSTHKSSNYAWEKRNVDDSSIQLSTLSAAEIAKSFSTKSNKKEKRQTPNLLQIQNIPKLASLSKVNIEDISQDEIPNMDESKDEQKQWTKEVQKNDELQEYQQKKQKRKHNTRQTKK